MRPDAEALAELGTEGKVCASRARDEYEIPDRVLAPLDCSLARNPHYRSAAPMRLYSREEVLPAAVKHHELKDEIERTRAAKRKAKEDRAAQRQLEREEAGPR